jgi:hypothetical protein
VPRYDSAAQTASSKMSCKSANRAAISDVIDENAGITALGALAAGTSSEQAADTISAHAEIAVWPLLLDSYGWDLDRVETRTNATFTAVVRV